MTLQKAANPQLNPVASTETPHDDVPATVLSRALYNEPHLAFMIPDEDARRAMLPWLFGAATRACEIYGICTTAASEGVALWIGPEHDLTVSRVVRAAMMAMPFNLERGILRRCMKLAASIEEVRRRLAPQPHWYLMALGSEPSSDAASIGGVLMEPVLSRAYITGVPCYLETFNEGRLRFYEDYGFRIAGAGQVPGGGPPFWAMTRRGSANVSAE